MTYIGIREKAGHHTRRAVNWQKSGRMKRKEDGKRKQRSVDWKLIVEISLLLFFFVFLFSLLDKGNKKMRRGWKAQMPESPHGLLCIHTKNKMTAIIKVITKACLGHEPQAWKQCQYSQWAVVFCGAMCHGQKLPILKCTPTIKAEWRVLGFSFGRAIIRKAWKDWKWPRFAQAGTPCASSASFIFFSFFCWFFHHWPQSLIIACSFRQCTSKLNCQGRCIKMTSLLAIPNVLIWKSCNVFFLCYH